MPGDSSTFFWVVSRAAGTTAIVLASASVGVGLTMGGRLVKRGAVDRRTLHEILALSTMVAVAVHGLALLGDDYFSFSLLNVTVPFLAPYRDLFTSIGIIAGWGMIVLGLTYYLRRRIGHARWKMIHRFTAVAWLLGLVHTFTVGTDAGKLWFIALIGLTAGPALALLIIRHLPSIRANLSPKGAAIWSGSSSLSRSPSPTSTAPRPSTSTRWDSTPTTIRPSMTRSGSSS